MRRRLCSICRKPGHRAPTCPNRPSPRQPRSSQPDCPNTPHNVTETRHFESLAALLDAARTPGLAINLTSESRFKAQCNEWTGYATLDNAIAMLAGEGSPDLAEKVRKIAIDMAPLSHPIPFTGEAYDVSGGAVDVERYLSGDPECMIDYSSPCATAATRDIYINVAVSQNVDAKYIVRRGAAICAAIDRLEAARVRVRLHWTMAATCRDTGNRLEMTGLVKDYHAPLDLDLIAFVFAHPAMMRQIGLHLDRQFPCMVAAVQNGSYGTPCSNTAMTLPEDAVYVPEMDGERIGTWCHDDAAMLAYVESHFTAEVTP